MNFDRAKTDDEYIKMLKIDLSNPPETLSLLFSSASDNKSYATDLYELITGTAYTKFPPLLSAIIEYSDPDAFKELEEKIQTEKDEKQAEEYKKALQGITETLRTESEKFNNELAEFQKEIQKYSKPLKDNSREDLTSGAFFYGKVEEAMQKRGVEIVKIANMLKDVYIEPINDLKAKIEKYDAKISAYLDPQNSFDNFMKALPSADEFSGIAKFIETNPDAAVTAMKAAYSTALKGLEYIGNDIVNIVNMEERRELQKKLDDLTAQYKEFKRQYGNAVNEYDLVKNLVNLISIMKFFAEIADDLTEKMSCVSLIDIPKSGAVTGEIVSKYYAELLKLRSVFEEYWQ